jgi:uncharacterized protein (DUF924 family)
MKIIEDVLMFWFGDTDPMHESEYRKQWFVKNPAFDAEINDKFMSVVDAAAAGEHDELAATAAGSLALCILLDQFPRNLFRGNGQAFATDDNARRIASRAIEAGHDQALAPVKRIFLYLPFEHSENLPDQIRSVELYRTLGNEDNYRYALEHHYVISRFGRFPARNIALGRQSTDEEEAFLATFNGF